MTENTELRLDPTEGASADFSTGSVFFVGTATVILRYAGFTILTDPNFLHASDHAHLGYGLTAQRLTDPALEIEDLPPLDFSYSRTTTATTSTTSRRRSFRKTCRS